MKKRCKRMIETSSKRNPLNQNNGQFAFSESVVKVNPQSWIKLPPFCKKNTIKMFHKPAHSKAWNLLNQWLLAYSKALLEM